MSMKSELKAAARALAAAGTGRFRLLNDSPERDLMLPKPSLDAAPKVAVGPMEQFIGDSYHLRCLRGYVRVMEVIEPEQIAEHSGAVSSVPIERLTMTADGRMMAVEQPATPVINQEPEIPQMTEIMHGTRRMALPASLVRAGFSMDTDPRELFDGLAEPTQTAIDEVLLEQQAPEQQPEMSGVSVEDATTISEELVVTPTTDDDHQQRPTTTPAESEAVDELPAEPATSEPQTAPEPPATPEPLAAPEPPAAFEPPAPEAQAINTEQPTPQPPTVSQSAARALKQFGMSKTAAKKPEAKSPASKQPAAKAVSKPVTKPVPKAAKSAAPPKKKAAGSEKKTGKKR